MNEFIEKLIGRLEEEHEKCINRYGVVGGNLPAMEVKQCMEIVNQLAEEYKPNTNDAWKIIYDNVCNLEKEYANKGNMASVNDCIRLENLLQYFKEELHCSEEHEHFRAMTNADKIKAMNNAELAEFLSSIHGEEMQEKCPNYKSGCWYSCTIEHACENAFSKTLYLNWLKSEAE